MNAQLTLALLLLLLLGCSDGGPARYAVTGTVSYEGQALPTGNVMFVPESGPATATTIGANGNYTLRAIPGKHQVIVTAIQPPPADVDEQSYIPPPPLLPARFGTAQTSGVVVSVEAKHDNQIDIVLN